MAASDDAAQRRGRWTLVDDEGNVQGSDSDIGSSSSSDCVAVEEDVVSYHAKRSNDRSSASNSITGSPPRNQMHHSSDFVQDLPSSSSWLGGFWTKSRYPNRSPANSNPMLHDSEQEEPLPSVCRDNRDTLDTESLSSIEVLSMPSDGHSDTDTQPKNRVEETPMTFDPDGATGTDWGRHGDVVKAMYSSNIVSSTEGLPPSPPVEDMASSSNSSQLDFLMVNHPSPMTGALPDDDVSEANDFPIGAVGGRASDEDDQMERSVGIVGPLPMMPHGQLPLSSVSVDNIPRGVETGDSPRRAQSEGCIPQQSEGSSGVGVPVMTQRWPTEDGGFLLVQQFRGDGEPAMSRSSSFSDLSSSFSYPGTGVRRRIPTNSCSSLNRQSSETSSSEASHYHSDTSTDALPANMTVSGIKPGIRQYLHQRDESLNSKLTMAAMIVVTAAFALVLGHYIGSMQATSHHLGIEAGQVWRLRSLQDQLVTCLDKTKTLMRGARGSNGSPPAGSPPTRASTMPDSHPTAKLLEPPAADVVQQKEATDSCSDCPTDFETTGFISEFCYLHCMPKGTIKDEKEQSAKELGVTESMVVPNSNEENVLDSDGIGSDVENTIASETQSDPESKVVDTAMNSLENAENSESSVLQETGDESLMDDIPMREAKENEGAKVHLQDKGQAAEISPQEVPTDGGGSSSSKEHLPYDDVSGYIKDEGKEVFQPVSKEDFSSTKEYVPQGEDVGYLDDVENIGTVVEIEEVFEKEEAKVDEVESLDKDDQVLDREEEQLTTQDQDEKEFFDSGSTAPEEEDVSQDKASEPTNDGDFTEKLSSKLSESWFILRNFTTELMGSAANLSVNNVTTQLKENVETLRHQIKDAVSSLQKSNITTNLKDNVNSAAEHVKHTVSNITEGGFGNTVKETMQDLEETIHETVSTAKETGSQLKKPFKDTMKAVKDLMRGKPMKSRKYKNEDQSSQDGEVKSKPSANKEKKENRRPQEQSRSEKKEAARNKRKEDRKKNFATKKDENYRDGRKSIREENIEDEDNSRNRYAMDKKEKSHLNLNVEKAKSHGNSQSDRRKQNRKRINNRDLMNKDRNDMQPKSKNAQDQNQNQEYSENKSVPSRKMPSDINIENKRKAERSANFEPLQKVDDNENGLGDTRGKLFEKKNEQNTNDRDHQRKQSQHHKTTNHHHDHRQGNRNHENRNKDGHGHQDKGEDARRRFEDIEWEDIFEHFDVRCFGVHDCLRKHREGALKLYEELLDYQDWLTERCYKKHLEELKDFMEELEEFLAEPFLKDADLEELMEDFEDMAEDIEEATTKSFWKFMRSWTPRRKESDQSKSNDHTKQSSNKKKPKRDEEKTLTVTLDLKKTFNFTENAEEKEAAESKDSRKHAGYGYQSNDDWFIRRMKDREESRNHPETTDHHQNEPNWYNHWMQGRENSRTGMTVWDLYQWFSKRQALRHEWRLHEMDDQSNWFLRRP